MNSVCYTRNLIASLHGVAVLACLAVAATPLPPDADASQLVCQTPGGALTGHVCEVFNTVVYQEPYQQLQTLGRISDSNVTLERTFMSPAHHRAATLIEAWMQAAGLLTWVDAVGNVHGRLSGSGSKTVLLGSHYDTVLDAGKYDGALGIVVAIAAVKAFLVTQLSAAGVELTPVTDGVTDISRHMLEQGRWPALRCGVEVIAFSDEEGVRFSSTFLGSRAVAGTLLQANLLNATDAHGLSFAQVLAANGVSAPKDAIESIAVSPDSVSGYVEVHIEQGVALEQSGSSLGVVSGIAGQTWLQVEITGEQGHAGTVPMHIRKDALVAAAELATKLEGMCGGGPGVLGKADQLSEQPQEGGYLVCTVGKLTVWPGASNVIAGTANMTVDIRSDDDQKRRNVVAHFLEVLQDSCRARDLQCLVHISNEMNATHSDDQLTRKLVRAVLSATGTSLVDAEHQGCPLEGGACMAPMSPPATPPILVSGAGHDALAMADLTGIGMLFVRCFKGISHSPLESVSQHDVTAAVTALHAFLVEEVT